MVHHPTSGPARVVAHGLLYLGWTVSNKGWLAFVNEKAYTLDLSLGCPSMLGPYFKEAFLRVANMEDVVYLKLRDRIVLPRTLTFR